MNAREASILQNIPVRLESGLVVWHTRAEYERLVKNVVCPECGEPVREHREGCVLGKPVEQEPLDG